MNGSPLGRVLGTAGITVLCAVTACSGREAAAPDAAPSSGRAEVVLPSGARYAAAGSPRVLLYSGKGSGSMDAAVHWTVRYDAGGDCLYAARWGAAAKGDLTVPLFPEGAEGVVADGKRGFRFENKVYLEGEEFVSGISSPARGDAEGLPTALAAAGVEVRCGPADTITLVDPGVPLGG